MRLRIRDEETNLDDVVEVDLDLVTRDQLLKAKPVRQFSWHPRQRHHSGYYWSATEGTTLTYESRLELKRLVLADFDRETDAIRSQPFTLFYLNECRHLRRHTPDFLTILADHRVRIIDVKNPVALAREETRADLYAAHDILRVKGYETEIWTGPENAQFALNVTVLAGYRNSKHFMSDDVSTATRLLRGVREFCEAEEMLRQSGISSPRPLLLHLLWSGVLVADLSVPLDGGTLLEGRV